MSPEWFDSHQCDRKESQICQALLVVEENHDESTGTEKNRNQKSSTSKPWYLTQLAGEMTLGDDVEQEAEARA